MSGKDYIRCDARWICIVIIKLIDVKHKDPDIIMMFSATLNQEMNQCLNAWNPQQQKKISINYPVSPICPSPANVNTIFWPISEIINSTLLVNTAAPSKQAKTNLIHDDALFIISLKSVFCYRPETSDILRVYWSSLVISYASETLDAPHVIFTVVNLQPRAWNYTFISLNRSVHLCVQSQPDESPE